MGASTAAKYVKCPYYKKHDIIRIVCEGVQLGNTIHLVFDTQDERRNYMKESCNSILGCRDCLIHIMLTQMYEERENG